MTFKVFLLSLLLFSVKVLACKCNGEPSLKSSFKNADFVLIGEVYDISEVPSGFKTVQNILSKVKINKVYKSNDYGEFYQQTATLFGSPLHSCDVLFTQKGKYLIFAYEEKDTGFLLSDHCFVQKRLDELSSAELQELESLSSQYKKLSENSDTSNNTELTDLIVDDFKQSDREIKEQKKEILTLNQQNNRYKTIIYISTFVIVMLLIALILLRRRTRY
ncbi:hypothetical protein WH221_11700 [Chryseobacterium culicis]|uniref:Tissue inhibitor of metalloproteinase n=1 Tax=Chryseobacterium culicis TaxID=680127 RepID=A0A2S9D281_CHRCI|nr:hypothetical protein [Chryseobacterium culicis]PRB86875.1 hypothetical protein CQ022_11685 [Chryseobacterium culicis]PRB92627.1 hypothetical protein CQ033_05355 [Chryseobacterium culicis]